MVSLKFILAVSLAISSALASPTPTDSAITAGQVTSSIHTYLSGLTHTDIYLAIGYFREAKTKSGKSGYPKRFYNNEKLKFQKGCRDKKVELWELPVLDGGKRYPYDKPKKDAPPGSMRVYYTKDLKFCGIGTKSNPNNSGKVHLCRV
ncbi:Ribonuclease/ribotoxin [Aspergillus ambiguus]|uniref:Ribonuclease/ribotoxin n=1 Tax=Aspergillus ambiguus TaxID=176160 RepID=UPI003CCD41C4